MQTPIQWVLGILSPGIKQPGREADNSHPNSAEVKKTWIYISTLSYIFMAKHLVKHRDNLTFPIRLADHKISSCQTVRMYCQE
jgi:hypothetical protein